MRRSAAGSIPTTGCGATPARWPVGRPLGTSRSLLNPPPRHNYRSAVMVLVGVGAVMAVVAWVIVLLSPASDHPLGVRHAGHGGHRAADHAGRGAERAAGGGRRRPGTPSWSCRRPRPTAPCCSSASPSPRGGSSPPPPTCWAACGASTWSAPAASCEPASVVATDKTSDVALVSVPEDLPVRDLRRRQRPRQRDPDLALTFVPAGGHAVALHCTTGAVTDVGTAIASGPASTMPSITSSPPRRRSSPASRC